MKGLVVFSLVMILLLSLVLVVPVSAQSCSSPGAGSSTDFTYDSAQNTYVVCGILSAQATINAYTPTPTATLMPTPAAVLAATGCDAHDKASLYQDCVINDSSVRSNSYVFWAIPLILIAIVAFGVTQRAIKRA